MKQKIQNLLVELNHGLVEREETMKAALLAILAGENLLLIGPPGTGKSMIARRIADRLASHGESRKDYFEYLLTKFSTPEEIFGPLSITELKSDRFRRNTAGYLPTVKTAFLDEIFKASSSILNALLTILNERVYHNGTEAEKVPMQALIAASNELPSDQEELSALYDRFMMRRFVDYVSEDNLPRLFEEAEPLTGSVRLTDDDFRRIREAAAAITIPPDIITAVQRIWVKHKQAFKNDARESLSDRRLKKAIKILRTAAATNGRNMVDLSDVFVLKDCLWNHPDNAAKVRDLVLDTLRTFSHLVLRDDHNAHELSSAAAPKGRLIKGFKGSGTEADPFLIKNFHDLMGLERLEVGQQGYYFLQTADIDCTDLTSPMNIRFVGHYDGAGHTIKRKNEEDRWALFSELHGQSSVTHLNLDGFRLADAACDSEISFCYSTDGLISEDARDCAVFACRAHGSLIAGKATGCNISRCRSGLSLIKESAIGCTIRDCMAIIDDERSTHLSDHTLGGIAADLSRGSIVERCFVAARVRNSLNGDIFVCGIAHGSDDSAIRHCAIGKIELLGTYVRLTARVANARDGMENNASLDINRGADEINGGGGRSVAAALFKQHYFEHSLGWDFDSVWEWDAQHDRPQLRSPSRESTVKHITHLPQKSRMTDLLAQQMRDNIWV